MTSRYVRNIERLQLTSESVRRFCAKVEITETCWLWTGSTTSSGYGSTTVNGQSWGAHRLAYEIMVGPIPSGLQLDHVKARGCTNRHCVNPAHMEPVTHAANMHRSDSIPGINSRRTECVHGHPLSGDNVRVEASGRRQCRKCEYIRGCRKRAKQRALVA